MNNEPVAWMGKDYDGLKTDLYFDVEKKKNKLPYRLYESAIPLYTHPAELTDEEIEDECRKAWGLHDQDQLNLEEVFKFARAILRKAQE